MAEAVAAGTIREGHYIVIQNRACKVFNVSEDTSDRNRKRKTARFRIVAHDIFNQAERELTISSRENCIVPQIDRTDYRIESVEGRIAHLLPQRNIEVTDDDMLDLIENGLAEGKNMFLTVMSALGVEQICGVTDVKYPQ